MRRRRRTTRTRTRMTRTRWKERERGREGEISPFGTSHQHQDIFFNFVVSIFVAFRFFPLSVALFIRRQPGRHANRTR